MLEGGLWYKYEGIGDPKVLVVMSLSVWHSHTRTKELGGESPQS